MSVASEITRLQGIKSDIRTALVAKGITSASTHNMADFAEDIGDIQTGGGNGFTYLFRNGLVSGHTWVESKSIGTISTSGSEITISFPNSTNRYCYVGTQIDLTDIDILIVKCTLNTYTPSNVSSIFASTTMPASYSGKPTNSTIIPQVSQGDEPKFVILDVTSLTGLQYVGFGSYAGPTTSSRELKANIIACASLESL